MEERGTPIHVSRALDEGDTVGLTADVFRGLRRNVFLQKHARYLLTANLWVDARLFNGRDCLLEYVVYASVEDQTAGHPVSVHVLHCMQSPPTLLLLLCHPGLRRHVLCQVPWGCL